jgi:hypothetical protein
MLSACSPKESATLDRAELVETGLAVSDALTKNLGTQLKASLQGGNPASAVQFCAQVAEPLTDQTSGDFEDVTISRISLDFRNPANQPDETDAELLTRWEQRLREGKPLPSHELVAISESSTRFYRPIRVQQLCLTCHGDSSAFTPELTAILAERYPDDLATGYQENDLRGAFRVEISK